MAGLKYWVWLSECRSLTTRAKLLLLERFGSPEGVYYAEKDEYLLVEGIGKAQAEALAAEKSTAHADRILGACERLGVRLLTMQDAEYPMRLRNIFEPPCLLYVKGRLPVMDEEVAIAVVGTRGASPYGLGAAEKLSYGMAKQGALIVSGGASGIDAAAHRGALRAGARTVALLGCGVDVAYPSENQRLFEDIAAMGALVSEYPPGTKAEGWHFPLRNRILSGLCLATLVVEAPERSGALITARTAVDQGRDVFAVPGPINAPQSRGCNRLIAEGAGLVMDSWDILREYEAQYPHKLSLRPVGEVRPLSAPAEKQTGKKTAPVPAEAPEDETPALPALDLRAAGDALTDDQKCILHALHEGGEMQVDDLIEAVDLPTRRVLSALTMLEIDGYVAQGALKRFSLCVRLVE